MGEAIKADVTLALHAKKLAFYHPKNNDLINLEAPLPNEYVELVYELNSFYA